MIYHGNFVFTPLLGKLTVAEGCYLTVDDEGIIQSLTRHNPSSSPAVELGDGFVLPGFVNLHIHSSQLPNKGVGYDVDLPHWLDDYTYPTEHRYGDPRYYIPTNHALVRELWQNGITRSVHMSTTSLPATAHLIQSLAASGLGAMVGKMNSDQNPFGGNPNEETQHSIDETKDLIRQFHGRNPLVDVILSPEFAPCCSREVMTALGELAKEYHLPVMTHLSESPDDLAVVKDLFPYADSYGDVYRQAGLFGQEKTAMIHCIYATQEELSLMAQQQIHLVYCPLSNMNLAVPKLLNVRDVLNRGIPVGLGTDVGAGHTNSMIANMVAAVQLSKQVAFRENTSPLTVTDSLYLATKGGGSFFGKVGSFETGYAFDALIIDDSSLCLFDKGDALRRLERFVYSGDDRNICRRFCNGKEIR